jgi:hypothetical protein
VAFDATAVYAGRSMILYSAPYADDNEFPALTVLYGTAWGAPWVDRGYTQEGVEWEITHDFSDIEVDQELSAVLTVPSGQTAVMRTNLAEFKMDNIALATGQGEVTTTAAGVARGEVLYELTGDIADNLYSWGMDFRKNDDGEALRVAIWRGKSIGAMAATFGVADANPRVPVEVRGYPDTAGTPARRIMSVQDVLPIAA